MIRDFGIPNFGIRKLLSLLIAKNGSALMQGINILNSFGIFDTKFPTFRDFGIDILSYPGHVLLYFPLYLHAYHLLLAGK